MLFLPALSSCCWMDTVHTLNLPLCAMLKKVTVLFFVCRHTPPMSANLWNFGLLKRYWKDTCHAFYQKHPSQVISKLNFCAVFREAWLKAITPENIIGGFKKSGIYPFNPGAVSVVHHQNSGGVTENTQVCSLSYQYLYLALKWTWD